MKYTTLGSSGIHVSQLCVGCMSFGDPASNMHAWTLDPAQSDAIIRHALDLGINFFDTANTYSAGTSEEYLGRAIKTARLTLERMETMWLPVQKDWRLNERHYGALEGKTRKEVTETSGEQQVKIWRRSFDVPPPPMSHDDLRSPAKDPRYQAVPRQVIPQSESLKDTIARVQPYWQAELVPSIRSGKKVLVVAHSTLLRALVANFSRMSEEELQKFEIPNTVPLVFQLDENLKPVSYRILGAEKIRK